MTKFANAWRSPRFNRGVQHLSLLTGNGYPRSNHFSSASLAHAGTPGLRREYGHWGARLTYPTPNRAKSTAITAPANKLRNTPFGALILRLMSRDFIAQLYADTPCWLWPVLWIEIYWMQVRLARLPDADDPQDLYEVRLNEWGQLQLIKLFSHDEAPDLDAWMSGSRLDSDLFATEFYMYPHLRRMPEPQASTLMWLVPAHTSTRSRPAPGIRNFGVEARYLDPG